MIKQPTYFNITGPCFPGKHYLVDTSPELHEIVRNYIERGLYFTINRPRQYGKTTTLFLLESALASEYLVLRMSFEGRDTYFDALEKLVAGIKTLIGSGLERKAIDLLEIWERPFGDPDPLEALRTHISALCTASVRPIVVLIDEVDKATNYQVFNAFLGLLRDMYINREGGDEPTFQSVVLAGVTDIKNLKRKIRPDEHHGVNSPWNIAADFTVDLSFSATQIAGMLATYEEDHATGMDIGAIAQRISFYTSGYPFLVSKLCKMIDEGSGDWTVTGIDNAETKLLGENNTLFDDLGKNVLNNESLKTMIEGILFEGVEIGFGVGNPTIDLAAMYGIIKEHNGKVRIANVIFETRITNMLLSIAETSALNRRITVESELFIKDGKFDLDTVVERFALFMKTEYRAKDSRFIESNARLLFLTYLRPIINGQGHYAVEPETRGARRMDIRVFYNREEYIIELKIWRGESYEQEGIKQLASYLSILNQKKGWLVSFCDLATTPREGGIYEVDGCTISETIVAFKATT